MIVKYKYDTTLIHSIICGCSVLGAVGLVSSLVVAHEIAPILAALGFWNLLVAALLIWNDVVDVSPDG